MFSTYFEGRDEEPSNLDRGAIKGFSEMRNQSESEFAAFGMQLSICTERAQHGPDTSKTRIIDSIKSLIEQ